MAGTRGARAGRDGAPPASFPRAIVPRRFWGTKERSSTGQTFARRYPADSGALRRRGAGVLETHPTMSSGDALRLDAKVPLMGRRERLFPRVPLEEWFGRSRAIREGIVPIVVLVLGPQKGRVVGVEGIDGVPPIR